jgi:hypothetical protein
MIFLSYVHENKTSNFVIISNQKKNTKGTHLWYSTNQDEEIGVFGWVPKLALP